MLNPEGNSSIGGFTIIGLWKIRYIQEEKLWEGTTTDLIHCNSILISPFLLQRDWEQMWRHEEIFYLSISVMY